jgi:SAM-dependent methyltransferase
MKKAMSLLRTLEYKELSTLENIDGRILDLGGDKRSGYHELIKGNHKIEVVNLNNDCGVDLKFDIEKKFPIESEVYDAIVCMNVLEHIFNYQNVLDEGARVLKKGGKFVGVVPFLFNIHGSPDDYFRYTRSALEKMFQKAGFHDIEIRELGGGLFSILFQLKFGLFRPDFVKKIAMWWYTMLDTILIGKILNVVRPSNHLSSKSLPLGYFFTAKK